MKEWLQGLPPYIKFYLLAGCICTPFGMFWAISAVVFHYTSPWIFWITLATAVITVHLFLKPPK